MENYPLRQLLDVAETEIYSRDVEVASSRIKQIKRKYGDLKSAFQELCRQRSYIIPKDDLISEDHLEEVSKICAELFGVALQVESRTQNFKVLPQRPLKKDVTVIVNLIPSKKSDDCPTDNMFFATVSW